MWEADREEKDNIMLWAACCMCFFGFLRSGEIYIYITVPSLAEYDQLSEGDVKLDSSLPPQSVQVAGHQDRPISEGVTVFLGRTCAQ